MSKEETRQKKDVPSSSSSSSDDEPLEIVDFSRVGLFEGAVHEIVNLLLATLKERQETTSKSCSPSTVTSKTFTLELPEPLQGIQDFEQALHGSRMTNQQHAKDNNNNNISNSNSMTVVATLVLRENQQKDSVVDSRSSNSNKNHHSNHLHHHRLPIEGLLGTPSYLYLRPKQRVMNLSPQLNSTLLSIGLSALDEVNSRRRFENNSNSNDETGTNNNNNNQDSRNNLINLPVIAPCGNRFSMSFKGISSFFSSSPSSSKKTHAEFVLPTQTDENTHHHALLPIIYEPKLEDEDDDSNSKTNNHHHNNNIVTEYFSRQVNLSEADSRSMSGLSTLDGLVDFFVNTTITGKQSRFLDVSSSEIGKPSDNDETNNSSSATTTTGTIWADVSRVYRSPVPYKQRWKDTVLALWNPKPNGHSRAHAGLLLGFDDPSWNQHLAGCPSLSLGTSENPIESFSIELGWEHLSVEATSITDNESSSWFDDIIHGLFVSALKNHENIADAGSNNNKQKTNNSNNNNTLRMNPAASAAIASLGPPTSVQVSTHLRHRGEISSRVAYNFSTFVRNGGQVLAVQLDDARRKYLLEQSAARLHAHGDRVRQAVSPVAIRDRLFFGSSINDDEQSPDGKTSSNKNSDSSSSSSRTGIRSAVSSWVSALWSTGTTAVNAVAHQATDAIKRSHPEEYIVSRKSLLSMHCNNVLAALRRPDGVTESFIVAKPVRGLYSDGLKPNDLRRQIPPGSIVSRFAVECATLKHADMVKEFWMMLVDVLKEVLTGSKGRDEMKEEYSSINALQLIGDIDDHQNTSANHSRAEELSLRSEILTSCLLVDLEEGAGVDCVADIFHQKMQALAICSKGIADGHQRSTGMKKQNSDELPVEIESPKRLLRLMMKEENRKKDTDDKNDDNEPIFAPPARRFVTPITYGDDRDQQQDEDDTDLEQEHSNGDKEKESHSNNNNNKGYASRILLRDMNDFLRVNAKRKHPVSLADFLAWFSPADVLRKKKTNSSAETKLVLENDDENHEQKDTVDDNNDGRDSFFSQALLDEAEKEEAHAKQIGSLPLGYIYLSSRMKSRGNAWRESWHIASKMLNAALMTKNSSSSTNNNNNNDSSTSSNKVTDSLTSSSSVSNLMRVEDHDEPLQEAMEIFNWMKQRSEREIMYVALKGQVAASSAQLIQHPIYTTLSSAVVTKKDDESHDENDDDMTIDEKKNSRTTNKNFKNNTSTANHLQKITQATISRISQSFPSWSDFDDCLQIYVDEEEEKNKLKRAMSVNGSGTVDEDDPIFNSVVPEIQHSLIQLFSSVNSELEKAEYLLGCALGICDAVSPFGSTDTDDLLKFTHNLVISVFKHIGKTQQQQAASSSPDKKTGNNNNVSSSILAKTETQDLPASWTSTIITGDTTERITDAVFLDPNLFFFGSRSSTSPSLCAAWLDSDRGSSSEYEHRIKTGSGGRAKYGHHHQSSSKIRKELMRRYRIYAYSQKVVPNQNELVVPGLFQRLNAIVDKPSQQVTLSTFSSKVL